MTESASRQRASSPKFPMAPDTRGPTPEKHMRPPTHRVLQELKVYLGAWLRSPTPGLSGAGPAREYANSSGHPASTPGRLLALAFMARPKVLRSAEKKSRKY